MGKNNRHKKQLKSERSKVKLKGRTLPKGTNVTNTVFKVRKIIIGEQLKHVGENKVDVATQIKDCLSKLRHHNQKICLGSLNTLKHILTKYSTHAVNNQFSSILKNLAHLATNEDRDVRRESFTVLQALLGPIVDEDSTILMPYYDVLSSYLCCAMTHIDPRIQSDSLLFLDVLLKLTPSIVTNHYSKIMDNFLDMISKLRIESKPERSLTLNLNSKISTVKWRVNVLQKLQLMLQVLIDFMKNDDDIQKGYRGGNNKNYSFNDKTPIYLGVYNNHNLKINELGLFSGSSKSVISTSLYEANIFQDKITTLMPLLFETWLEVKLNNCKDSSGCYVLNAESTSLLKSIMEIIISLRYFVEIQANDEKSNTDWFYKKYRKDFINCIVDGFPYSGNQNLNKAGINKRNTDCLMQNICICYMFVLFCKDFKLKEIYRYSSLLKYITNSSVKICEQFPENDDIYQIVENLYMCLFFEMTPKSNRNEISLDDLLESLIKLFYSKINISMRKIIFKILCKISQDSTLENFYNSPQYLSWIQSLPIMLCNSDLTLHEVTFLTMLARHKNIVFLESVLTQFPTVLDKLSQSADTQFVSTIINILYYIPGLTSNNINLIKTAVEKCNIPIVDKNYINTILSGFNI